MVPEIIQRMTEEPTRWRSRWLLHKSERTQYGSEDPLVFPQHLSAVHFFFFLHWRFSLCRQRDCVWIFEPLSLWKIVYTSIQINAVDGIPLQAHRGGTRIGNDLIRFVLTDLLFVTVGFVYRRWRYTVTNGRCRQIHFTRFSHVAHVITLTSWLKVPQVRISLHPHAIHDVTCLSVRLFSLRVCLSPVSLPLLPLFSLQSTCSLSATPSSMCHRRGLKPPHSRRMRSIAPWRYTIFSQYLRSSLRRVWGKQSLSNKNGEIRIGRAIRPTIRARRLVDNDT